MPAIVSHPHSYGVCAVVGAAHGWCPAQPTDSRSPCPALNTLANHGYLPRDGQQLSASILVDALKEGYGLSAPLADFLSHSGAFALGQKGNFNLGDLSRHNRIEHNASIAHDNVAPRGEYAPDTPNATKLAKFLAGARDGKTIRVEDVAAARVACEDAEAVPLDPIHSEIARGEMALVLGLFGGEEKAVPIEILRTWIGEERFPDGWKPDRETSLLETMVTSRKIRKAMEAVKDQKQDEARSCDKPVLVSHENSS